MWFNGHGQTLGGASTYSFLKLPASAMLSAAGGVNVSMPSADVAFAPSNPASVNGTQHSMLGASFNAYFKGAQAYTVTGIKHAQKTNTTLSGQIFFIDYGNIPLTDASGNQEGTFGARDFYIQGSVSRSYEGRWRYGGNIKFVSANYGIYKSSALVADFGILYVDSTKSIRAGLGVKNMGVQLRTFNSAEDLPFDLQMGVTKKLSKAPFGFSLTVQQAHRFNIVYNDTLYNNELNLRQNKNFGNKLFSHFIGAMHIYAGSSLEITAGYNRLRRFELNNGLSGNGLNGFSAGFLASFKKIQFSYARAYYSRSFAYNQFALQLKLSDLNIGNDL